MKVGIVGFPRAGKTTVFNALTGLQAQVGGYGDASKPNLGTIKVPDARIDRLAEIFQPRKTTFAEMVFVDFPGGERGGVLDQTTLVQMRDADALVQVVRGFPDPVTQDAATPARDVEGFKSELVLADLAILEKRHERLRKEKGKEQEAELVGRCKAALEAETPLRRIELSPADERTLSGFGLLSRLPLMVVVNVGEGEAAAPLAADVKALADSEGVAAIALCAQVEAEIAALDAADRGAFLADLGLQEAARDRFIQAAYGLLDLISFLTSGEDEVRAWPIRRGTTAVRAAGKIHSDIERGFIRAEVVAFDDFVRYGSDAKCREAGKLRLEGKDYVVQDGDIVHFRFNV
ncbi:MAG: redox-regulated ATPase YchF [Deltaproteobacteria bacterium]|nr:redox-regulated ATPase YchF [Deltaproteobacteria bacterium]